MQVSTPAIHSVEAVAPTSAPAPLALLSLQNCIFCSVSSAHPFAAQCSPSFPAIKFGEAVAPAPAPLGV